MRNLTTKSRGQNPEICLQREGGVELCGCLSIESQGVVFRSPHRVEFMADLLVRIECPSPDCCSLVTEGIVVGCDEYVGGGFEVTVLFLGQEPKSPETWGRTFPPVDVMLN